MSADIEWFSEEGRERRVVLNGFGGAVHLVCHLKIVNIGEPGWLSS